MAGRLAFASRGRHDGAGRRAVGVVRDSRSWGLFVCVSIARLLLGLSWF